MYAGFTPTETRDALKRKLEPSYMGTFSSAKRHVFSTFAGTHSAQMKKRVAQFMLSTLCDICHGKRLRPEALSVKFAGYDLADLSALSLKQLNTLIEPFVSTGGKAHAANPEKREVTRRITGDIAARLRVMLNLGLGYLSLERSTPTLSPGELQRLRLATQLHSNLFGVVYVLDEPSAGLHPADTESLLDALDELKRSGNSLFVVEHELDVVRRADWIVEVGPGAGVHGGEILYSGPPAGLEFVAASHTSRYLFQAGVFQPPTPREPKAWLKLSSVTRNNLRSLSVEFPLGVFTSVTGVSGSGKSTLVSQVLVELVADHLGQKMERDEEEAEDLEQATISPTGKIDSGIEHVRRLVIVDQKPIGRTPRSNIATYTGLFDHVRKLFASTRLARSRKYDAGRFSFNVIKGRCETCNGEGFVSVELLFLPSVYSPCPTCHGARFNARTLEIRFQDKTIADVLALTVDAAAEFFAEDAQLARVLQVLQEVGLGYLRLGQPATELSGGEAQRVKLATELQRIQRGDTLYILDEPTTGLHPSDVDRLQRQLQNLVFAGNTVVVVEHDMHIVAGSDWVIDVGPGAGDEGGEIVAAGIPALISQNTTSKTAPFLGALIERGIPPEPTKAGLEGRHQT